MGIRTAARPARATRAPLPAAARLLSKPAAAAGAAGLRYVSDAAPGIRRVRSGRGFRYVGARSRAVRDRPTLARIKGLAIPPAWTEVWICPDPLGHVQATGRDARGRKQYRYHPAWRTVRDRAKYDHVISFGEALPLLRERVQRDLALRGLPREKVLATVVRLLEATLIRVGNEEYARANRSYGLTTLRDGHVDVQGARISFRFRGKAGKRHTVALHDRRLSAIVKRCQDLPGQILFQYLDDAGARRSIGSHDVNAYVKEITGRDFTAKDFRTWSATVLAACTLGREKCPPQLRARKHRVTRAIEEVAQRLGNTPAICRKSYVHPSVVERYHRGTLGEELGRTAAPPRHGLSAEESAVLALLSDGV